MRKKQKNGYLIPVFLVIALFFTWPVFRDFDYWGIQDWDQHFFYHAVPRDTVLRYRQLPLWNPYTCGGTVLLANPQSRFLSPTFLLVLFLGAVRGLKIEIWLHAAIGLYGMYRLARHYRLDFLPALVSAIVFAGSSTHALNLTVGMTWYMSVAYLPWVFLFYLRSFQKIKLALISSVFLALIFFEGGAYPIAIIFLFLGLYSFFSVCLKRTPLLKTLKLLAVITAATLALGAVKLIPSIDFISSHPRTIPDYSGYSVDSLRFSVFSRDQTLAAVDKIPHRREKGFLRGVSFFMDENGMYLGVIPFFLILLGLAARGKSQPVWVLCLAVFVWISFGNRIAFSLWSLLHRLPVFDSMRVAQRFRFVVLFASSLFAGFGLQALSDFLRLRTARPKLIRLLGVTISSVILLDISVVGWRVWRDAFTIPPLPVSREKKFSQVDALPAYDRHGMVEPGSSYASFGSLYPAFLSNIGIINAYETSYVPRAAVGRDSPDYRGEIFLAGTEGEVKIERWSPNRIRLSGTARGEGYLVVNQNYYPGWRVKGEGASRLESVNGLLAVKITPPLSEIELYYLPGSFVVGFIVTAVSFMLIIIFLSKKGEVASSR